MGSWHDSEDLARRQSKELLYGRAHSFVFSNIGVGARLANMPARGTDLSTITKLGVTGMTGIGVRVASAQIVQNKGNTELHITAIEPEPYVAGTTGPELKGSRREFNQGTVATGERLFVSTTRTGSGIPVPRISPFTNLDGQVEGGLLGRVCDQIEQDKDTIPGLIFTRAHYKTAGWTDYRQPNVARVSLRGLTAQEELMWEQKASGKQIQGDCYEKGFAPSRYIVTKGDVTALKQKAIIVIETAYATLNPAVLLDYINTLNQGALTNLGVAAETCRMLAPNATRFWRVGALWYADYSMLYDPLAGHNKIEVIRQTKMPFRMPLLDEGGKLVEPKEFRTVYDWTNKICTTAGMPSDTAVGTRAPYRLKSWSKLDGMISWT
jgi:hypothetical protein